MKVALWTAGYGALSDSVIVPLLSAILEEFSDASETMRNLFVSGASAVMAMIFAMLTGVLMRHFSKRKLLILGTTLFAIGGIGGAFAHSMEFLLLTRMFDGMSDGIIMTTAASLVAQLFPDEKERSSFFSYNTVFSALFGMATASIAGVLCVKSWRLGFLANGLAFVPVILAILSLKHHLTRKKNQRLLRLDPTSNGIL